MGRRARGGTGAVPPGASGSHPAGAGRVRVAARRASWLAQEPGEVDRARPEGVGGLEHPETAERGASAVVDTRRRGCTGSDRREEGVELSCVALIGPPP